MRDTHFAGRGTRGALLLDVPFAEPAAVLRRFDIRLRALLVPAILPIRPRRNVTLNALSVCEPSSRPRCSTNGL